MVGGESHYFLGRRLRLRVIPEDASPRVALKCQTILELRIRPGAAGRATESAQRVVACPAPGATAGDPRSMAVGTWRPGERLGHQADEDHVGLLQPGRRRIWLNLELAKKPEICLHYYVCHELAHLIEPSHNNRFVAVMDRAMPQWRTHRKTRNTSPLAHETWGY